jgi:hypothetical protein
MSLFDQIVSRRRSRLNEVDRVANARAKFLADPTKVDSFVANVMREQLPAETKVSPSKFATKTDAVSAGFAEGDPRKEVGGQIKTDFNKLIASGGFDDTDPETLLQALTAVHLGGRAEDIYKFTRQEQASLIGGKPVKPMLGYDEWLAGKQAEEEAGFGPSANIVKDAPTNAAIGAGFAAAGQGIARTRAGQATVKAIARPLAKGAAKLGIKAFTKLAGRGLVAAPHPLAKIAGAALIAIPEFFAFEKAAEMVDRSEWGRANEGNKKVVAAELLLGLGAAAGTGYGVKRGLKSTLKKSLDAGKLSVQAQEMLKKFPTAENVILKHQSDLNKAKFEEQMLTIADSPAGKQVLDEAAELGGATARAKDLNTIAPLSDTLDASKTEARHASTKAARTAAQKDVDAAVTELERIQAETGKPIEALDAFKKEQNLLSLQGDVAKLEKKLKKAEKAGIADDVIVAGRELEEAKGALDALQKELGFGAPVAKSLERQLAAIEKQLATNQEKKLGEVLVRRKAKVERDIDNIIASNMARLSDDGAESVMKDVEAGKAPLAASEEAVVADEAIAKQATKSNEKLIEEAAAKKAADDKLIDDIAKRREALTKPKKETLSLAKKIGIREKELNGLTEAQIQGLIKRRSAAADAALAEGKQGTTNADLAEVVAQETGDAVTVANTSSGFQTVKPSTIKFGRDNPPPFLRYKQGEITAEEYAVAIADENVAKAEFEMANGTAGEKILSDVRREVNMKTSNTAEETAEDLVGMTDNEIDAAFPGTKGAFETETEALGKEVSDGVAEPIALVTEKGGSSLIKVLALAGPASLAMLGMEGLSPEEADASVASRVLGSTAKVAKELAGESFEGFVKQMEKFKPAIEKMAPGQKTMPARTVVPTRAAPSEIVAAKMPSVEKVTAGKLRSQHHVADELYPEMENPSVVIAEKVTAANHDTEATREVIGNILEGVVPEAKSLEGIRVFKEIRKATRPLEEKFSPVFAELSYRSEILNQSEFGLKARLKAIEKKAAKGVEGYPEEATRLKSLIVEQETGITKANEALKGFQAEHDAVMKPLAAKHSTVRIALAMEKETYPWVEGMLTYKEREAVAHMRGVMQEYAAQIEASGGDVIKSQGFVHHAVHPNRDFNKLKDMAKAFAGDYEGAVPFAKFHSRAFGSRQLMPDIRYIMERYVPDANKRIRMMEFWKKEGWEKHAVAIGQWSPAHKQYWQTVRDAFKVAPNTTANKLARHYTSLEVFRLLAGSPSVAFKHLVKVSASMAQFPIGVTARTIPKALKAQYKLTLRRHFRGSFGKNITLTQEEQAVEAFIKQESYSESIFDTLLGETPVGTYERMMAVANEVGSIPVRSTELFDRSFTALAGMEMASKKSMTVPQARHAIMKTILNNNFLGGVQNPAWMRDPKIRAMMMFQGTPFKIAERRLMLAQKTGKSVKKGYAEFMSQLKADIKEGEKRFNLAMINDAFASEKDEFGRVVPVTLAKEMMLLGALIYGGREALNADFLNHAFHLPLVKIGSGETGLAVTTNPVFQSMSRAYQTQHDEDSDFIVNEFFKDYFKQNGLPATMNKMMKLTENDIPERYKDARFPEASYFWGVPAVKTKE